jgi:hypothetical protein
MRRWTFRTISVVSLLLCMALSVLWWRSYRNGNSPSRADSFTISKHDPQYWVITGPGKMTLCRQHGKNWNKPLRGRGALGFHFGGLWGDDGSMLWNASAPFWALVTITAVPPVVHAGAFVLRKRVKPSCGFSPVLEGKLQAVLA